MVCGCIRGSHGIAMTFTSLFVRVRCDYEKAKPLEACRSLCQLIRLFILCMERLCRHMASSSVNLLHVSLATFCFRRHLLRLLICALFFARGFHLASFDHPWQHCLLWSCGFFFILMTRGPSIGHHRLPALIVALFPL